MEDFTGTMKFFFLNCTSAAYKEYILRDSMVIYWGLDKNYLWVFLRRALKKKHIIAFHDPWLLQKAQFKYVTKLESNDNAPALASDTSAFIALERGIEIEDKK